MAYVTYARQSLKNGTVAQLYYGLVLVCLAASLYYAFVEHGHLTKERVSGGATALYASAGPPGADDSGVAAGERQPCGGPLGRQEPAGDAPTSACLARDVFEAAHHHGDAIFFETHVLESLQRRVCGAADERCSVGSAAGGAGGSGHLWESVRAEEVNSSAGPGCLQKSYFVANVEQYMIGIEHHLSSTVSGASWGVRELSGALVDPAGREVQALGPSTRDALSLASLIRAAGLSSLDEPTDSSRVLEPCGRWQERHPEACCEDFGLSLRARGVYLQIDVLYSNLISGWLLPQARPWYKLRVRRVPRAEAYRHHVVPGCGPFAGLAACSAGAGAAGLAAVKDGADRDSTEGVASVAAGSHGELRLMRLATGVQVSVRQTGELGHFVWIKLLMWMVGLSAALGTAWNVCEGLIEFYPPTRQELYHTTQQMAKKKKKQG